MVVGCGPLSGMAVACYCFGVGSTLPHVGQSMLGRPCTQHTAGKHAELRPGKRGQTSDAGAACPCNCHCCVHPVLYAPSDVARLLSCLARAGTAVLSYPTGRVPLPPSLVLQLRWPCPSHPVAAGTDVVEPAEVCGVHMACITPRPMRIMHKKRPLDAKPCSGLSARHRCCVGASCVLRAGVHAASCWLVLLECCASGGTVVQRSVIACCD